MKVLCIIFLILCETVISHDIFSTYTNESLFESDIQSDIQSEESEFKSMFDTIQNEFDAFNISNRLNEYKKNYKKNDFFTNLHDTLEEEDVLTIIDEIVKEIGKEIRYHDLFDDFEKTLDFVKTLYNKNKHEAYTNYLIVKLSLKKVVGNFYKNKESDIKKVLNITKLFVSEYVVSKSTKMLNDNGFIVLPIVFVTTTFSTMFLLLCLCIIQWSVLCRLNKK